MKIGLNRECRNATLQGQKCGSLRFIMFSANVSPVADKEESSQPRGSAVFLRVGGAAALSLPSPNLLPYGQSDTSNLLYPLELEGGSSTSRCNNFAITDTLSHRDDLQPLLPGASSANVHLPLTEGSQSRDEAMEFVTISLFGLVCYLDILRVVALGPQSQKLRKIQIILSCLSASCLSSVPCFTSSLQ